MKVVSIGGLANNGTDYDMWLKQPFSQPSMSLTRTERAGGDPVISASRRNALTLQLGVRIYAADEDEALSLYDALLAATDTESAAVALVVSDDDNLNVRYRYVVTQGADEQPDAEGTGSHIVFTLVTHGETRWRGNTPHSETWTVEASAETLAVVNSGSLPARPTYTIQPTDAKSGSGARFEFKQFCAISWYLGASYARPVDITNKDVDGSDGLDTDALVTAGDMVTEDNVGVIVNGKETRRWIERFDTTTTQIWINLDFAAGANTPLLTTINSGDTVTTVAAGNSISRFPKAGILRINDELFTYSDKDDQTWTFLDVTRAAKGSTAATHTGTGRVTGSMIEWIQHDIWLVYGPQGAAKNDFSETTGDTSIWVDYDAYKPMIDLATSSNKYWIFLNFGQSGADGVNRTATWKPGGTPGGTTTDDADVYGAVILTRTSNNDLTGTVGPSSWSLSVVGRIYYLQIDGAVQRWEYNGAWDMAAYLDYRPYVTIPDPLEIGTESGEFTEGNTAISGTGIETTVVRIEQRCSVAMYAEIHHVHIGFDEHDTYFNETRYSYPDATLYPQIETYDLNLTLENVTTGQSITLSLPMAIDEQLEIDTEAHTVTLLDDGSSQYQALTKDARRKEMLTLNPGSNTLRVTETDLAGVTVFIEFEERTYS